MTGQPTTATTTGAFRALHDARTGFTMPNAWDAGTAILLADAGFEAIATTSAGIAFSLGRGDHSILEGASAVSREAMFQRVREIVDAVPIPVNGDLEFGYGLSPDDVAKTIELAIDAGLAGANIEDYVDGALLDLPLAFERIEAARAVITAAGSDFVLTARSDGQLLQPNTPLAESIERANRYREAGADCLYIPGVTDLEQNAGLVREIAGPLNVVIGLGGTALTVPALRRAGVAGISLGGTIARAAFGLVRDAARELRETGTLDFAADQIGHAELGALFARYERERVLR